MGSQHQSPGSGGDTGEGTSRASRAIARLLGIRGVGPARVRQILVQAEARGVELAGMTVDSPEWRSFLTPSQVDELRSLGHLEDEVDELAAHGIALVSLLDPAYPRRLRDSLGDTAPPLLTIAGNRELLSRPSVGFCGSRAASPRGLEVARDCADQLARDGCPVVSGYAAGVDMQAHRSALEAGGCTVLVLAEGIKHFRVKRELRSVWSSDRTCIVSELAASAPWSIANALRRNRTMVGLSRAMILIEARASGGSIATGRAALELGVPLFAPDYEGTPESAIGNRELFGHGARPLRRNRVTSRARLDDVRAILAGRPVLVPR